MSALIASTDQELIHRLQNNDRAAFTEIYTRYADSLAGFAASRLCSLDDARDILHDLFVTIWEQRRTITINSNLRSYLFTAIRYKVIDSIRRDITREEYSVLVQALKEPQADGIEKHLDAKELQQLVDRSLEALPEKTKHIYRLSRQQHYSIAEIAQLLGLSEQTVKNQLTIALKHLRQAISSLAVWVVMMDWLGK